MRHTLACKTFKAWHVETLVAVAKAVLNLVVIETNYDPFCCRLDQGAKTSTALPNVADVFAANDDANVNIALFNCQMCRIDFS